MTIALHWWYLPVFFFALAVYRFTRPRQGDYDFVTGIDGFLWVAVAIALSVGHFI